MSRTSLFVVILLAAVLLFFIVKKIISGHDEGAVSQKKGGGALMSEVMIIRDTIITYQLQSTGTIRANEEVSLVSEYPGKITGIFFKEGTTISKEAFFSGWTMRN